MYTAFFIGNIGAGKSAATRYLEGRGARRIDLDDLAKGLYVPGSDLVEGLAQAFGTDVLDDAGGVDKALLASRAFASPETAAQLNALVYPALLDELGRLLLPSLCVPEAPGAAALTVVEISNAASFLESFGLADEVVAVSAPLELRRSRALARGMDADDFDARAAAQPAEEALCALARTVIENTASDAELFGALDAWMAARGLCGQAALQLDGGPRG